MSLNHQLFNIYEQVCPIVASHADLQKNFAAVQETFEYKKQNPDIKIMVYGVYNAGKSTLINALVGKEVAATGDIPLTDSITEYVCRNYKILDTPGIDAPKEHEQVTQNVLDKADAVIFVVNPLGVVEEEKTLSELINLVHAGKKVFLVFNEKDKLSEENFIKLKDQTRTSLQALAKKRNLGEVLKEIPILKINAKLAFDGKQKQKEKFVEYSGYYVFEQQLDQFVESISEQDVYARLKINLLDFLNQGISDLEAKSNDALVKQYDVLVGNLLKNKIATKKQMNSYIESSKKELHSQVKSWLYNNVDQAESLLKNWIDNKSDLISRDLNSIIEECIVKINDDIDQLQLKVPSAVAHQVSGDVGGVKINLPQQQATEHEIPQPQQESNILNSERLKNLADLGKNVKAEHITIGLNAVKNHFPSIMKGVGPKAIEKMAGTMASKVIPVIGTAITIGLAIKGMMSDDPETAQLKRQQEAEQQARERYEQQIEDSATEISNQFSTSLRLGMDTAIDDFFNTTIQKVESIGEGFSEIDQENGKILSKLQEKVSLLT